MGVKEEYKISWLQDKRGSGEIMDKDILLNLPLVILKN